MPSGDKAGGRGTHSGSPSETGSEGGSKHVLVMEFMRNSIVSNPIMVSGKCCVCVCVCVLNSLIIYGNCGFLL